MTHMAALFVKLHWVTNKNDAADAQALCEAVSRTNLRFVTGKTAAQQAVLVVHRAR